MQDKTENEIIKLYQEILLRSPDTVGLEHYFTLVKNKKMTLDEVRYALLQSKEFKILQREKLITDEETFKKILDEQIREILLRSSNDDDFVKYSFLIDKERLSVADIRKTVFNSKEYKDNDFSLESTFRKSDMFKDCTTKEIKLYQKVKKIWENDNAGYHTFRFSNGYVLNGIWDAEQFFHYFKIPIDLRGKSVLEIGPSTGWFSFQFSKKGASVTTIDFSPNDGFDELNQLYKTNVKMITRPIESIDESFGKFDLVFCNDVLLHTTDIYGNIKRIQKVTKDLAIIGTILMDEQNLEHLPLSQFIGDEWYHPTKKSNVGTFFLPNMNCFRKMCENSRFKKIDEIANFETYDAKYQWILRRGILHCFN
jgi:2-polyprenyl-3-methyl-5-hydroxy-6-metoxy-1,4-benzoquinol methylase